MFNPGGHGMKAGDVTLHSGFTVHRSGSNKGQKLRDAIAIQYCAGPCLLALGILRSTHVLD